MPGTFKTPPKSQPSHINPYWKKTYSLAIEYKPSLLRNFQHLFHRLCSATISPTCRRARKTKASKSGFSGHFKTFTQQVETKVSKGAQRMFDLVASNPRILPLANLIEIRVMRESDCGQVCVPPGGARLVTFHYQHFGCPAHDQQWSDSRGRIDTSHCYCCIAKHP